MNNNKSNSLTRDLIFKKYNGHCAYCGIKIERISFHIDHIQALRRGDRIHSKKGKDSIENYNPSCPSCNSSKNVLSIEDWRREIQLKINRINRDSAQYRILKRFGLIKETNNAVVFYFETLES